MESRLFSNISVYKKKESNSAILENTNINSFYNFDEEASIDFIAKLDSHYKSEVYDNLNYHLGRVNPNNIVQYTDKLAQFRIDDYCRIMIPFLTDQNIIKFKNAVSGANIQEEVKKEIYQFIEEECKLRYSIEYTKVLFFNSVRTTLVSKPFNNCVIRDLYAANFMYGSNGNVCKDNVEDLIEIIKHFTVDETKCCQDFIYELIMAIATSAFTHAENIYRVGEEYNIPDYGKLIRIIKDYIILFAPDNCVRVANYAVKIAVNNIERYLRARDRESIPGKFLINVIEHLELIYEVPCAITENTLTGLSEEEQLEYEMTILENSFSDTFLSFIMEEVPVEEGLDQIDELLKLSYLYESKAADKVVKGANVAKKGVRKGTNVIRNVGRDVKKVTHAVKGVPQPFTDMVNNTWNKIKAMDKEKRRTALITGGFKGKLLRLIRLGIKLAISKGLFSALGPVYGSIAILVQFVLDGKLDYKVKRQILDELEMELKIVNEKLEDARGDNDKKAKYELMRLKSNLEREIKKIRTGIE